MSSAPGRAPGRGVLAALGCYFIWGLVPLYWRPLAAVDAHELIAHRLVWSFVFTAPLLWWLGGFREVFAALGSWRSAGLNLASSVLLKSARCRCSRICRSFCARPARSSMPIFI